MKNAGNVNYLQVDHEIQQVLAEKGVTIMSSPEAYRKFRWTWDHFRREPEEGYFIWVKKQIDHPLTTCIAMSSPKVSQNPGNLVVIEENIKVEIHSVCNAIEENLRGEHVGHSKIIVKENSELKMRHLHSWGKRDLVESGLEFLLGKGAGLSHTYKCLSVPRRLKIENITFLDSRSSANSETVVLARGGEVDLHDSTFLNGEESGGVMKLRMIADKGSRISSHSRMIANNAGKGHLDCTGLLLDEKSVIDSVPELLNKNKKAILTHEASIGRISEESLNYLRSRGLTEDEAINLIVTGFLGEDALFTYKNILSKDHM
ncbi:MAG: SufD family Fe-S cluster assembly protein [Candidatus Altiarchaeales archaeon]|nr:SufD family Fe-S cluster assembly protein [Candidatus Altiarchaeales archaeon]